MSFYTGSMSEASEVCQKALMLGPAVINGAQPCESEQQCLSITYVGHARGFFLELGDMIAVVAAKSFFSNS